MDANGTLVGTSNAQGGCHNFLVLSPMLIEGDYEIRGEIDSPWNGGLALGYTKIMTPQFAGFVMDPQEDTVYIRDRWNDPNTAQECDLSERHHYLIQVKNGRLTATVNDTVVFKRQKVDSRWWSPHQGKIGLGGLHSRCNGHQVRYRKLEIRRLP